MVWTLIEDKEILCFLMSLFEPDRYVPSLHLEQRCGALVVVVGTLALIVPLGGRVAVFAVQIVRTVID